MAARTVSILGSTGSVGESTLDLLERSGAEVEMISLTGGRNVARLAEQARGRVPRGVDAIQQPAAIRAERQHDPHRQRQSSGKMRQRRVDRHHQVHLCHQPGRIREILLLGAVIDQHRIGRQPITIHLGHFHLQ